MKTQLWLRRSAFALCLAAFGQTNHSLAQEQKAAIPVPPGYAQPASQGPRTSPYLLDISNGTLHHGNPVPATLGNVVSALREMWPDSNIAVAPDLAGVRIEDLKLRSVTELPDALDALRVASGYRFEWRRNSAAGSMNPATGLPVPGAASQYSLYVLDLGLDSQGKPLGHARRIVEAFNMSRYLDERIRLGKSPVDKATFDQMANECLGQIERIIRQTLESLKGDYLTQSDHPDFQYHPGTGLLIVIGTPEAIDVARKVLTALPGVPAPPPSEAFALSSPGLDPNQQAMMEAKRQAAREAFSRRYGLRPSNAPTPTGAPSAANPGGFFPTGPITPPSAPPTPRQPDAMQKAAIQAAVEKAIEDVMVKRYGLRPPSTPPPTNAPVQPEQAPPAETAPPR